MSKGPENFMDRYRLHVWAAGAALLIGALFWTAASTQSQFLNVVPIDSERATVKRP